MGAREDQIARIQRIERIKELEAKQSGAGEPGPIDAGVPPAEESHPIINSLRAGAKGLDVLRGNTTAPLMGLALEGLTGKKVFDKKDWDNAADPTNLETFPSASEMYKRAGVPEGAKLSDYVPGYADPKESNPWYQPEKGGLLDPTIRGAGGFATDIAIDPLTYLSFGASGAARKAAAETATQQALKAAAAEAPKTVGQKILSAVGKPIQKTASALSMPGEAALEGMSPTVRQGVTAALTPASSTVKQIGRAIYNGVVFPVEQEGVKYGKYAAGDALYNVGAASPMGLRGKAADAVDTLMGARDKILGQAGEAGGQFNMNSALKGTKGEIEALRARNTPQSLAAADVMEKNVGDYEKIAASPTANLKPQYGANMTSDLYSGTTDAAYNELLKTPAGQKYLKKLAAGSREETLNSVNRALGEKSAGDVAELNDTVGKLLSTKRGQQRVQNTAERAAANSTSLTGTDPFYAMMGHESGNGLTYLAAKKIADALRAHAVMPTGYGLRKLGESEITAPLIDNYARQKYKDLFNIQGDPNGQEK